MFGSCSQIGARRPSNVILSGTPRRIWLRRSRLDPSRSTAQDDKAFFVRAPLRIHEPKVERWTLDVGSVMQERGLEALHLSVLAPKTSASANSATPAGCFD